MHLSSQARNAFTTGNYHLAVELYSKAIIQQPELSHIYLISLNISRGKLGLPAVSADNLLSLLSETERLNERPSPDLNLPNSKLELAFQAVSTSERFQEAQNIPNEPLVSVLIPTHNCSKTIEQSLTSLLRQTWKNIEIIVVDLCSSDATWTILQRIRRSVSNIRCYRLNTPQGLHFGLNYAFKFASGDFIFFQNSDDFSHPDRIRLSMLKLMPSEVSAVRGTCLNLGQSNSTTTESSIHKILTLGIRRNVFQQTGNLSLTTLSDEEYLERLHAWSHHKNLKIISDDLPLYYHCPPLRATYPCCRSVENQSPEDISDYRKNYRKAHSDIGPSGFEQAFSFPATRLAIDTPPQLSNKFTPAFPVVASICSIPEREHLLKKTLASIAPQVDQINIYLDRYDSAPEFVKDCHTDVKIYLHSDYPELRDNGKFIALAGIAKQCYYFTIDDDIIYPPDYVERLILSIEKYSRQVVVGLHGVLLPEHPAGYYTSYRKVYSFNRELEVDTLVNNLGTGTVAFHTSLLRGLNVSYFKKPGMADLYFSVFCKNRYIPMVAIARPDEWLKELPSPNTSLYHEFKDTDNEQSKFVQAHSPWGYASIQQTLHHFSTPDCSPTIGDRLVEMIPSMWECLK